MSDFELSSKKKTATNEQLKHGFSIIIANYNYEAHVLQAVQSGLNQDYPHDRFEVIVVDDGSTDNSRQVIADIAAKNDKLRVITQANLGQAAAFYAGVSVAKYEWICFLDSDDFYKPEKLSVLNTFIDKQQGECDFICHNVDAVDEATGVSHDWFLRQKISTDHLSVDNAQGGYPFANPCGQVYRKSLLYKIAPWINLTEWQRGADNPIAWASLFINGRVCYLKQSLAIYRIHANNFFLASTPSGLVPKVNWLERWPKLLSFLNYLHQGMASGYIGNENREELLVRLEQFFKYWEKKFSIKPNLPYVSFITTCKNRLDHLKQTLPRMVKQSNAEVIVVDYGCTQGTRKWVRENYPQVRVVAVDDDSGWNISRARNLGAAEAKADWLCFIDADIMLENDLSAWLFGNAALNHFYIAGPVICNSQKGTSICSKDNFYTVEGYDEAFVGWMPEDGEFYARLNAAGFTQATFPSDFISTIHHGDEARQLGLPGYVNSTAQGMRVGMVYQILKDDIKKITGTAPDLNVRKLLLKNLISWTTKYESSGLIEDSRFVIKCNNGLGLYEKYNLDRQLVYSLHRPKHIFKSQVLEFQQKQAETAKSKIDLHEQVPTRIIPAQNAHKIAMFHIGRSGSSVLADMLNQHPKIQWDGEIYEAETQKIQKRLGYFRYGASDCHYDPIGLLKERFATAKDYSYGFEVKFNQLEHCGVSLEDYLDALTQMDVGKIIVLRRNNIFRKIVSSLIAEVTNVWHVAAGKKAPKKTIKINPHLLTVERKTGSLIGLIDHYAQNLKALDKLLSNVDVLQLSYEEDIEANPLIGYSKVAKYLSLENFKPSIRLSKTNPYKLFEVVENIDEIRIYLKNTDYAWMLDGD